MQSYMIVYVSMTEPIRMIPSFLFVFWLPSLYVKKSH